MKTESFTYRIIERKQHIFLDVAEVHLRLHHMRAAEISNGKEGLNVILLNLMAFKNVLIPLAENFDFQNSADEPSLVPTAISRALRDREKLFSDYGVDGLGEIADIIQQLKRQTENITENAGSNGNKKPKSIFSSRKVMIDGKPYIKFSLDEFDQLHALMEWFMPMLLRVHKPGNEYSKRWALLLGEVNNPIDPDHPPSFIQKHSPTIIIMGILAAVFVIGSFILNRKQNPGNIPAAAPTQTSPAPKLNSHPAPAKTPVDKKIPKPANTDVRAFQRGTR
jgi:hypothetical protein